MTCSVSFIGNGNRIRDIDQAVWTDLDMEAQVCKSSVEARISRESRYADTIRVPANVIYRENTFTFHNIGLSQ